jgi:hypothetical protein
MSIDFVESFDQKEIEKPVSKKQISKIQISKTKEK